MEMTNTDLEMFMENLRKLVYENYYTTSIGNNPLIEAKKPEIRLLYEELCNLIAIHEPEDVGNWKTRLIQAALEAEDSVDMFVSSAIIKNDFELDGDDKAHPIHEAEDVGYWQTVCSSVDFAEDSLSDVDDEALQIHEQEDVGNWKTSLIEELHESEDVGSWKTRFIEALQADDSVDMFESSAEYSLPDGDDEVHPRTLILINNTLDFSLKKLKVVMDDLKSMKEEMKGNLFQNLVKQDMMMDNKLEDTRICSNSNTTANPSAKEHEQLIVGFEDDVRLIMDRLTGYHKKLDIISIVGMGGLGKTTLATKIFNNSFVKHRFHRLGWVTVSQAYSKRDMLLQLLVSLGKSVHEAVSESKLYEMLYKSLKGMKYLIVIDDIWSCKAWDDVGICFPDDNTGSRVLVTTRLTEVASHTSQGGFTHSLGQLTQDQSWELLCRKTFRGYECPESLTETGKHIANKCGGLPLALVVIAGLLEKGEKRKDSWEKIAESVGSYVINDPEGCLDTLALSYDHLPSHLKKCFLYVGGFPEDYKIQVRTLIRLWIAEGFIKEAGQRSLEEEGEHYFMDLIDRNLLIVADKRSSGGIKSCRLHDLLRQLCLKKADEENFFKKMSMPLSDNNPFSDSTSSIVKQRRLFIDYEVLCMIHSHDFATRTRSVMCFQTNHLKYKTTRWVLSFLLLRVLDLLTTPIFSISEISMLVHLRYLAVWLGYRRFSFSEPRKKANLGSLQTLIVKGEFKSFSYSPGNTENLRHLRCDRINFPSDFGGYKLFHLQTVSRLSLRSADMAGILNKFFPNIKKLGCIISSTSSKQESLSFVLLSHLEALTIEKYTSDSLTLVKPIRFPEALKKLTLKGLSLPWSYMSTIQRLPKLEVLKLLDSSFTGQMWETGDEQFQQLKYLKLEKLNIRFWEASSISFPHLRKLVVRRCEYLKEIPLDLGNIYTLEHIETDYSNSRVLESVKIIQEAQDEMGNYDFHVNFIHMDPSEVFFEGNPFFD